MYAFGDEVFVFGCRRFHFHLSRYAPELESMQGYPAFEAFYKTKSVATGLAASTYLIIPGSTPARDRSGLTVMPVGIQPQGPSR